MMSSKAAANMDHELRTQTEGLIHWWKVWVRAQRDSHEEAKAQVQMTRHLVRIDDLMTRIKANEARND